MREVLLIVARAANGVIGRDGALPWSISVDLKRFKKLTMGQDGSGMPMVMGRKTFDSLPGLLPGRRHIVLTRQVDWQAKGAEVVHSVEEALALTGEEAFAVIGGAEVFDLFWDHGTNFELTEVCGAVEGDTFMRSPADDPEWHEVAREPHDAGDTHPAFAFVSYRRQT